MKVADRFVELDDNAAQTRVARLRREVVDLQKRVQDRSARARAEGRWIPSDPIYQRLASALERVRRELQQLEQGGSSSSSEGAP
jgi:hypothetical protein